MAYLIPSSIFKNVFANEIRSYILPHLIAIYDYTTEKLFNAETNAQEKERLTSSTVIILEKGTNQNFINYIDIVKEKTIKINKKKLETEEKWIFEQEQENTKGEAKEKKEKLRDYFRISNTIATLYNKAYVIPEENIQKENQRYIYLKDGRKLEKEIIKFSASPKKLAKGKRERIIFPYNIKNGKVIKYQPEVFEKKYPSICQYLHVFDKKLTKRKTDINANWYEYGRSQAIESILKSKLLISTVITKEIHVYILPEETIPYSGIYIQPIGNKTLEEAKEILESNDFLEYVRKIGIHACGESYRITSRDIGNYELK